MKRPSPYERAEQDTQGTGDFSEFYRSSFSILFQIYAAQLVFILDLMQKKAYIQPPIVDCLKYKMQIVGGIWPLPL